MELAIHDINDCKTVLKALGADMSRRTAAGGEMWKLGTDIIHIPREAGHGRAFKNTKAEVKRAVRKYVEANPGALERAVAEAATAAPAAPNGNGPTKDNKDAFANVGIRFETAAPAPTGPPPTAMRQVWEMMTPERAYDLLLMADEASKGGRIVNRKRRSAEVDKLVRDIKRGDFRATHQGIGLDEEGVVIDGQHRLQGVFEAGVAVPMWVCYNVPRESIVAIDQHRARSLGDTTRILGLNIPTAYASIAKVIVRRGEFSVNMPASREESIEWVEKHREAIEFVVGAFSNFHRAGVTRAAISGTMARAFYTCDRQRLREFATVLEKGVGPEGRLEPGDTAAVHLRNLAYEMVKYGAGAAAQGTLYRKAQTALKRFLDREPIKYLRESTDEQFVVPGEEAQS